MKMLDIRKDNSSYMNAPYKHDLWLYQDGEEIHLGYTEDAELVSEEDNVYLDESVAIIQYWQHLDKEQLKELHDSLREILEDYFNILYQDGYNFYSIEELEDILD